jgi:hypothetical protein
VGADGLDKDQRVICYKDGVLGVAVRIDTGTTKKENSLKSYRSMYGSNKPAIRLMGGSSA